MRVVASVQEELRLRILVANESYERLHGILMERHSLDESEAFTMLRAHSRRSNLKVVEVARFVAESHLLLPSGAQRAASEAEAGSTAATPRS